MYDLNYIRISGPALVHLKGISLGVMVSAFIVGLVIKLSRLTLYLAINLNIIALTYICTPSKTLKPSPHCM